jgi:hypothetical protein
VTPWKRTVSRRNSIPFKAYMQRLRMPWKSSRLHLKGFAKTPSPINAARLPVVQPRGVAANIAPTPTLRNAAMPAATPITVPGESPTPARLNHFMRRTTYPHCALALGLGIWSFSLEFRCLYECSPSAIRLWNSFLRVPSGAPFPVSNLGVPSRSNVNAYETRSGKMLGFSLSEDVYMYVVHCGETPTTLFLLLSLLQNYTLLLATRSPG